MSTEELRGREIKDTEKMRGSTKAGDRQTMVGSGGGIKSSSTKAAMREVGAVAVKATWSDRQRLAVMHGWSSSLGWQPEGFSLLLLAP